MSSAAPRSRRPPVFSRRGPGFEPDGNRAVAEALPGRLASPGPVFSGRRAQQVSAGFPRGRCPRSRCREHPRGARVPGGGLSGRGDAGAATLAPRGQGRAETPPQRWRGPAVPGAPRAHTAIAPRALSPRGAGGVTVPCDVTGPVLAPAVTCYGRRSVPRSYVAVLTR